MKNSAPFITLGTGLEIGYDKPLARLEDEVTLTHGTHFLVARNGRGKTTLLKTLAGTHKQVSGQFQVEGFTQYLPESMRFDPELPAKRIFQMLLPKDRWTTALELAERIELDVKKPYGRLSTGNHRKTSLILAEYSTQASGGNILLLDEPFSGLDVFARETFEDLWRDSGTGILRLLSCHPDYDSMSMPSTLLIENGKLRHLRDAHQHWSDLKKLL
jgi:ABC-type multidrug transport system ATPase subunit